MKSSETRPPTDDRGVSDILAVGTLVGLAVLLVLGIGINVFLFAPDSEGAPEAEFSFRHVEAASSLMITHESGDPIPSQDLYIEGREGNSTWTALAGWEEPREVEPDAVVQASEGSAFGQSVGPNDQIRVVFRNSSMNETTTLAGWNTESAV